MRPNPRSAAIFEKAFESDDPEEGGCPDVRARRSVVFRAD
jgi:hypothetical protein